MKAIVLHRRDFREYDQIVSFYTEEAGKREALAKGIKKIVSKHAAHLEPGFLVEAEIIPGKEIDHVIKAIGLDIFPEIRQDVSKSIITQYILSVINKMTDVGQSDRRIYYFLLELLEYISHHPTPRAIIDVFILKFFSLLGFQPELSRCVVCGREDGLLFFSFASGGTMCEPCSRHKKEYGEVIYDCPDAVQAALMVMLYGTTKKALEQVSDQNVYMKVQKIVRMFAQFHTDKKIDDWAKLPL